MRAFVFRRAPGLGGHSGNDIDHWHAQDHIKLTIRTSASLSLDVEGFEEGSVQRVHFKNGFEQEGAWGGEEEGSALGLGRRDCADLRSPKA